VDHALFLKFPKTAAAMSTQIGAAVKNRCAPGIAARQVRIKATAAKPSAGIPLQAPLPGREPAARLEVKSAFAQA
jgi:hypothetical protein